VRDRPTEASALDFSLVREDGLHDAQRLTRLMPLQGFGLPRRMAILIAITWLPLTLAALLNRRAFEGTEPLLQHFGVHVRFLVAIPLFILAEPLAETLGRRIVSYFLTSGLVPESERTSFVEIVQSCRRLLRAGLGFLQSIPTAFAPVIAASSAVLASRWGTTCSTTRCRWSRCA
jgi:hypothetical protein